jgi:HSP20 family protein
MLTLWDPRKDSLSLRDAMNRLFEQSYVPASLGPQSGLALDVIESADEFVVKAAMPGADKDKINVSFEDDTLTLHASLQNEVLSENSRFLLRERFSGEVRRSVTLPVRVDAEKAAAEYKDGILTLTLPKAESVKPRTIKIG